MIVVHNIVLRGKTFGHSWCSLYNVVVLLGIEGRGIWAVYVILWLISRMVQHLWFLQLLPILTHTHTHTVVTLTTTLITIGQDETTSAWGVESILLLRKQFGQVDWTRVNVCQHQIHTKPQASSTTTLIYARFNALPRPPQLSTTIFTHKLSVSRTRQNDSVSGQYGRFIGLVLWNEAFQHIYAILTTITDRTLYLSHRITRFSTHSSHIHTQQKYCGCTSVAMIWVDSLAVSFSACQSVLFPVVWMPCAIIIFFCCLQPVCISS